MSFFLSLSSSFSVSVSPSLSLCLYLSTYLFISLPLPFSLSDSLLIPFSLSDSLPLPFSLSPTSLLSHSLSLSLSLSLSQGIIVKSQAIPAGLPTQFCAAFGAGFFMACTVAPFDMVSQSEWVSVPQTLWFFLSIFYYSRFVSFFYSSLTFLISFCFSSHFILFFIFQVRTRLMNQPSDARIYSGAGDCFMQIVKKDGFKGLYAGKYIRA